jgi:hypothetical protein
VASVDDLRAAALACPGAHEQAHWGAPAFRVGTRIFAQVAVKDWEAGGPYRAILKLDEGRRMLLCEAEPAVFSPCVWGTNVSLFVALEGLEPDRLSELVEASWRTVAPKRRP